MNLVLKPAALAMLVTATQFAVVAHAQTPTTPAAPIAQPVPAATKTPKAGASAAAADTQALGDKLVSGATRTRDEVAKGFDSLGKAIDAVGKKIGGTKKASPFKVGG